MAQEEHSLLPQCEDQSLDSQHPHKKVGLAACTGSRERHQDPWGLLAGQPIQIHKLQAWEESRPQNKKQTNKKQWSGLALW